MNFLRTFLVLAMITLAAPISAMTTETARQCAIRLIEGYDSGTMPKNVRFAWEQLVRKALGPTFNQLHPKQQELMISTTQQIFRTVFTQRSSYTFSQPRNISVAPASGGYKIKGDVTINDGNFKFVAFATGIKCGVWEVIIADWKRLTSAVKAKLGKHRKTGDILRRFS